MLANIQYYSCNRRSHEHKARAHERGGIVRLETQTSPCDGAWTSTQCGQHVSYKRLFYLSAYFRKTQPVTAWAMDAQLYSRFFFASPECCLLRCVSSRSYSTILSPKSASLEEPSQRRTAQSVTEHRGMFGAGGLELEWLACFSRLNELLAINLEGSPFISIGLSALHLEKK